MGILKNRLAKTLRELADKVAPEPLGIYIIFEGDKVPADAKCVICMGPRATEEQWHLDTEKCILLRQVEMNGTRDGKNDMSYEVVKARWEAAGRALPDSPDYVPDTIDDYYKRQGERIEAELAATQRRPLFGGDREPPRGGLEN
jgi:hypothetical protein